MNEGVVYGIVLLEVHPGSDARDPARSVCGQQGAGLDLDAAAQELFRLVFFVIHYLQVWALGRLPILGGQDAFFMVCLNKAFQLCIQLCYLRELIQKRYVRLGAL
jgi:hypothetical protein